MNQVARLIKRLDKCPAGERGWSDFEKICTEILTLLFVPPLDKPHIQPKTYSRTNRRDAVFPNKNFSVSGNWGLFYKELDASMILCEFKNYDRSSIGHREVIQTNFYLRRKTFGRLALMVCSKTPNASAHKVRNTIFSEEGKVILFLTKDDLKEMLLRKQKGEDPSDLLADLYYKFKLQHE